MKVINVSQYQSINLRGRLSEGLDASKKAMTFKSEQLLWKSNPWMDISGSRSGQAKTYNLNRAVGMKNSEKK